MSELRVHASLGLGPLALDLHLDTTARTLAVDGPSGAGKSSFLRMLAGLEPRARGTVVVDGAKWMDSQTGLHLPPWNRRVGWVPQDALLFPHRSVFQNLAYGRPEPADLEQVARMLRVEALLDRRPRHLSGGERQRVAIGRALLASPRLLLLDEPFAALDAELREELAAAVGDWCAEREVKVVLVSHDTAAAEAVAEEHWTLTGGALRLRGDADRGERRGARGRA